MKKYIPGIVITMFLGLWGVFNADTMALDSDYKNNLLKVDVVKANDGSYKVDLFTQKPYNEPIKVIKKSDTNYYILLPETYHSITSVGTTGDINKVDVKLFPYAGQDLNNGYTKINISTSKPVTFSANVRTAGKQTPHIDSKKLAQLDSAFDGKPTGYSNVQTKPVAKPAPVKTEQAKKTTEPVKTVNKPANVTTEPIRIAGNPPVHPAAKRQEPAKTASNSNEIEIVTKPKTQPKPVQETVKPKVPAAVVDLEEVIDEDIDKSSEALLEEEAKEQGLTELATGEQEVIPELTKKDEIKQTIKSVLRAIKDNILMLIAALLALIAIILLVTPKTRKTSKEDVQKEAARVAYEGLDSLKPAGAQDVQAKTDEYKVCEPSGTETPAETQKEMPDENGIYEPKLMQNFEEVEAAAVAMAQKDEEPAETSEDEADVLASESFGENRGLCLVNYDGNIALIGYIEDEIFVIQNFGKITLLNPNIQIRIAEQNDNDTIYIVKTANSKLMVRETKDLIGLEMVM